MKTTAYTTSEAAYLIHNELGAVRAWEDMLKDMRRKDASYCGLRLLPFCINKERGLNRPFYRETDVKNFIEEARLRSGSKVAPGTLSPRIIEEDLTDKRHWKFRKLPTAV